MFPNYATIAIGDDFNRANENPLAGNWQNFSGAGLAAGLKIVSNQATSAGGAGAFVGSQWKGGQFTDCEIFVKVVTFDTAQNLDLKLRLSGATWPIPDPAQNGYQLEYDSADAWRIYRIDNGTQTVIGGPVTSAIAAGDQIGFEIVGSSLKGYSKIGAGAWSAVVTATDSTYSSGFPGIVLSGVNWVFDDVGIGGVYVKETNKLGTFGPMLNPAGWF